MPNSVKGEYKDNWTDRGSIQHKALAVAAPVDISILLLVKALIVAALHSWESIKLAEHALAFPSLPVCNW